MSTNPSDITKLLLAQLSAESYLDGTTAAGIPIWQDEAARQERLKLGSNNYRALTSDQTANTASLPGQTRMTDAQVTEFNTRYEVRDHLSNTITGFSATLLWDRPDNKKAEKWVRSWLRLGNAANSSGCKPRPGNR